GLLFAVQVVGPGRSVWPGELVRLLVLEAAPRFGVAAVRVGVTAVRVGLRVVTDHLHRAGVSTGRSAAVATCRGRRLFVGGCVVLPALVVAHRVAGSQLVADGGVVGAGGVRLLCGCR